MRRFKWLSVALITTSIAVSVIPAVSFADTTATGSASNSSINDGDINSEFSSAQISQLNNYTKIVNGKMVLNIPSNRRGHWHYVVTKTPFQAAYGVSVRGWEGALGGGWISGREKDR